MSWMPPARAQVRTSRGILAEDVLLRDEAGFRHQRLVELVVIFEEFHMSLPVRKIGFSACFSM